MAITATNNGGNRVLVPTGNHVARCYKMIHIGTVQEVINGQTKMLNKVVIGWELPEEQHEFKEGEGKKPLVISKEYTLSMYDTAHLRKMLESWRGKGFSEDEAKAFDVTKLIGVQCLLNVIHKTTKSGGKTYEDISSVTPLPKTMQCPKQINDTVIWDYDNPDQKVFDALPEFIRNKIVTSVEYITAKNPGQTTIQSNNGAPESADDLPF